MEPCASAAPASSSSCQVARSGWPAFTRNWYVRISEPFPAASKAWAVTKLSPGFAGRNGMLFAAPPVVVSWRRGRVAVDAVPIASDVARRRLEGERAVLAHPVQPWIVRVVRSGGRVLQRRDRRCCRNGLVVDEVAGCGITGRGPRGVLSASLRSRVRVRVAVHGADVPADQLVLRDRRRQVQEEAVTRRLVGGPGRLPPGDHALAVTRVPRGLHLHREIVAVRVGDAIDVDPAQAAYPRSTRGGFAHASVLHRQL